MKSLLIAAVVGLGLTFGGVSHAEAGGPHGGHGGHYNHHHHGHAHYPAYRSYYGPGYGRSFYGPAYYGPSYRVYRPYPSYYGGNGFYINGRGFNVGVSF